ncbi:unnamed protein product [Ilex paraguariensis]|uniref:Coilin N-terminal domain-containing protein n=1 Tax=Ilex paraguariensis TaxID=185542 RepID=A0ABC8U8P7_9AQUA
MESEGVRVRLVFEDRHVLSKAHRLEGLKRSWLLLKPQHQAIADVSTYLIHIFDLYHSCPNGILLSMDGFVLPPFESTSILKNEDVISVKKKGIPLLDIVKVGGADNAVEAVEIVEKQPVHTGVPLLANEKFEKETRGYPSETEENEDDQLEDALNVGTSSGGNAASKKRKASEKLKSPKRKKQCTVVPEDVDTNGHTEQIEKDGDLSRKNLRKKEKVSNNKSTQKISGPSECSERSNDNVEATPSVKR